MTYKTLTSLFTFTGVITMCLARAVEVLHERRWNLVDCRELIRLLGCTKQFSDDLDLWMYNGGVKGNPVWKAFERTAYTFVPEISRQQRSEVC